ncbi:MAG: LptE family protein [bacterium]
MKLKVCALAFCALVLASACTVSYKFNGASIDYTKTKSIAITDFPNNAALVYTPLTILLNDELKNIYASQTRLKILNSGGDMELEGAITGYTLTPLSVGSDALASETQITLTVKIRFSNNVTDETVESSFTSNRTFETTYTLEDVQDTLIEEMVDEIVDQIFNATVANW